MHACIDMIKALFTWRNSSVLPHSHLDTSLHILGDIIFDCADEFKKHQERQI